MSLIFSKTPETFDPVDMVSAVCEFICTMIYPIVFVVANIDMTVISLPAVGVNDAFQVDMAATSRVCFEASGTISV